MLKKILPFLSSLFLFTPATYADPIVADLTLPTPSFVTCLIDVCTIIQGTQVNRNLFHSFSKFSIPVSGSAFFDSPSGIKNIITRVTGTEMTEINGLLESTGNANFFLINPHGIFFGRNAFLQVGGSFYASTASSIIFQDGTEFSAINPENPLLTMSVPVGLQFGNNPGNIRVTGNIKNSQKDAGNPSILTVSHGQTLGLIGGNIEISGTTLQTAGGRIVLGGMTESGTVIINENGSLLFPIQNPWADISILNNSNLDVSNSKGGKISIYGNNLLISNSNLSNAVSAENDNVIIEDLPDPITPSLTTSRISNLPNNTSIQSSNIILNARNQILISSSKINSQVSPNIDNNGGDINIIGKEIIIGGNTIISAATLGIGNSGNINIEGKTVSLNNTQINASTFSSGNAGNINIIANQLEIAENTQIAASTFFTGKGGNLNFFVLGNIDIKGSSLMGTQSEKFVNLDPDFPIDIDLTSINYGNAGQFDITAETFRLQEGSQINLATFTNGQGGNLNLTANYIEISGVNLAQRSGIFATTEGTGKAGNLIINTNQLLIQDGGRISNSTRLNGDGGTININANKLIELKGISSHGLNPSGIFALSGELGSRTQPTDAKGNGGFININTPQLKISNLAELSVSGKGTGPAGNLFVNAQIINLDQGIISAETKVGNLGNIDLKSQNYILMRNQSKITTNAQDLATGGNININTPFIFAIPNENSDITANAIKGRGGNINITTQSLYGISFQNQLTQFSDITASSELGIDGIVTINTPGIDPSNGLSSLPETPINAENLMTKTCSNANIANNKFKISGKGGLPLDPYLLTNDIILSNYDTLPPNYTQIKPSSNNYVNQEKYPVKLIEAQGWIVNKKGEVMLVENSLNAHNNIDIKTAMNCQ